MARPIKLTPATREQVATGLARGATHKAIAASAKISVDALDRWIARANRADHVRRQGRKVSPREQPFLQLFDAIADAEAAAELHALREVMNYVKVAAVDLLTASRAASVPFAMLERIETRAAQVVNRRDGGDRLDEVDFEFLELADGYLQAEAAMEIAAVGAIRRAQLVDWRAATWWLERKHPDKYGHPNRRKDAIRDVGGRPIGATSAPDRPATSDPPPPRIRLREVR